MKNMKKTMALILALSMIFALTACSSGGQSKEEETYVLKFSSSMTKEEALGRQMELLASKIEEYTDGRVSVETYYNGELGADADVAEMVQQGANIFEFASMGFFSSYSFDLTVMDGPFFFYEPEEIETLKASDWWDEQMANLAAKNLYCMDTIYFGARSLLHKAGPDADMPEDFKGITMRTSSSPMYYAFADALTGNTTTIAWSEVYAGLSAGVAEMCEAPLASIIGSNLYEVCPYVTLDEHIHGFIGIYASKSWVDSLPQDIQDAIRKAVAEVADASIEYVKADEIKNIEFLKSKGVTVIEVEDKAAWAEATKSAYESVEFSEGTYERCMEILGH